MAVDDILKAVSQAAPVAFNRGIEREALRVSPSGNLAATSHPEFLGSKLTHPFVTTDFCEAQLELITGVHQTAQEALAELRQVHQFVYSGLGDEILWSASMPCVLAGDGDIPLAYYGESNLGRLKTTYRSGLGLRYGRAMQTICAVHYNFSLADETFDALYAAEGATGPTADYRTRRYFDLMRNFRRWSWLLAYLFGASPAVCNSFIKGRRHNLAAFDEGTAYLPCATSLRSGNLGYQSDIQARLINICYNSLDNYVEGLASAICQPHPDYEAAAPSAGNSHRQVNASVLQSEAEFYSSVRAKRVPPKGVNFLRHLRDNGVQYIEVRLLDVNPYLPLGIDETQIDFIDTFLVYCLLAESPLHDDGLCAEVDSNLRVTVLDGRNPAAQLADRGRKRRLGDWGAELLDSLAPVAQRLDRLSGGERYTRALGEQQAKMADANLTPSGQMLRDMERDKIPFFRFAMDQSLAHKASLTAEPLPQDALDHFAELSAVSRADQAAIEAADDMSFDDYLARFQAGYQSLLGDS